MVTSGYVQWQEYSRPDMLVMCGRGFGDAAYVVKAEEVREGIPGRQQQWRPSAVVRHRSRGCYGSSPEAALRPSSSSPANPVSPNASGSASPAPAAHESVPSKPRTPPSFCIEQPRRLQPLEERAACRRETRGATLPSPLRQSGEEALEGAWRSCDVEVMVAEEAGPEVGEGRETGDEMDEVPPGERDLQVDILRGVGGQSQGHQCLKEVPAMEAD
ncbi:hypothetical protein VPH35_125403 [Triticum aestivum]